MKVEEFEELKSQIPKFQIEPNEFSSLEKKYFSFYGLDEISGHHSYGYIESGKQKILTHFYKQEGSEKTAILMHGYYTHSGYPVNIAKHLSLKGYNIICYDMPGHGLSTGDRLEIDSFSEYTDVLINLLKFFDIQGELISFGHSTGAIPIFDASMRGIDLGIKRSFLLAPLIRTNHYTLSKISYKATKNFVNQITRKFRRSSHDEEFLTFIENDPLQERFIPNSWLDALFSWNDQFENFDGGEQDLVVLQGEQDGTVDWKHNMPIINDKFPNSRIHLIENAEHQLMNESPEFMDQVFKIIDDELI